ncbi:MAG TPA: glycosyltransferase [Myxococcota bacterium]|nr:glycosyltransferase [Myxococcota bacterium]
MTATPLRVAHVTGERGFSGGEVQLILLMNGLRARGHANLLVCPPGSAAECEARARGFAVECVPMRSDLSIRAAYRISAVLRRHAPSLVHCHTGRANWLGGAGARFAGVPALSTRRMDRRVSRGLRTRWLYGNLLRRAAAISPAVARRLRDGGVPPERIRVIWSAVDPAALAPSAPRAALRDRLGAAPDTPCMLVAAHLVHRKGVDVLLAAAAALAQRSRYALWIAGDGPERAALEASAARLGIGERVHFLGHRADVPDLLEACDVFALPSRHEGLGVAALEAMARARPVVASAVGGLAEIVVPEETGLLVPPGDAAALAGALERLLAEPAFAMRLGAAGAKRVSEHFRADQMVSAYELLYREILAECSDGAAP